MKTVISTNQKIINTLLLNAGFIVGQLYKKHKHLNKQWAEIMEQRMETLYRFLQNADLSVQYKKKRFSG